MPDTPIGAPGDWSAALFWFAHARLHPQNRYRLSELSLESVQGDSVICQWFRDMNMSVLTDGSSLVVKADSLERRPEMVLDVRDCLDTVPVMAALAALLPADITFLHVGNLQYKESDRLRALVEQLRPYADISSSDEHLRVCGRDANPTAVSRFNTHHDHRLAMAFLLFGRPDLLDDTDCLRKSYPGLLQDLNLEL
jgi:3-phosphoshikimate 1-carboxyvinyltransferase